jgi:hypothetical protein
MISEKIGILLEILHQPRNRQIGKTSAACLLALQTNGILLTIDKREADRVKDEYEIEAIPFNDPEKLLHLKRPLVTDPDLLFRLLDQARQKIESQNEIIKFLEDKFHKIQMVLKEEL